jgi:hypothetical protein
MSSEPIVGYKRRSAPDAHGYKHSAPDASDSSSDDGSEPERGKEAEAAGPKLDQAERQRNKKLRRDGEARNLSRAERKKTPIIRQIEEMELKKKAVKTGPSLHQLEDRVAWKRERKWVRIVAFATDHVLCWGRRHRTGAARSWRWGGGREA